MSLEDLTILNLINKIHRDYKNLLEVTFKENISGAKELYFRYRDLTYTKTFEFGCNLEEIGKGLKLENEKTLLYKEQLLNLIFDLEKWKQTLS